MSVLNRGNSVCKGPGVGGSTGHKIAQSSVAGVQRRGGVVRNEAKTGQGPSRALWKIQPHKQVTTHRVRGVSWVVCSWSPEMRVPRPIWRREEGFPDEAASPVQPRDPREASCMSPHVNFQVADPTVPQKNREFAPRHHEQQGRRGSGCAHRSEPDRHSMSIHLMHHWTLLRSPQPLWQSLQPFETTSPALKCSHVYSSKGSSERLRKGRIPTATPYHVRLGHLCSLPNIPAYPRLS